MNTITDISEAYRRVLDRGAAIDRCREQRTDLAHRTLAIAADHRIPWREARRIALEEAKAEPSQNRAWQSVELEMAEQKLTDDAEALAALLASTVKAAGGTVPDVATQHMAEVLAGFIRARRGK